MIPPRTADISPDPDLVVERRAEVAAMIDAAARASGRDAGDIAVVAVGKYLEESSLQALLDAGYTRLGENRFNQLRDRHDRLGPALATAGASWEFIGRLQSRQAPRIAEMVSRIQTLASDSAARRLARWVADGNESPELLVQVNIDDDPAKDGLAPDEVEPFLDGLPDELVISGFMTMPAQASNPDASREAFASLRRMRDKLRPVFAGRHELVDLSMGTSQDFVAAVEEGATIVRLGGILYQERN